MCKMCSNPKYKALMLNGTALNTTIVIENDSKSKTIRRTIKLGKLVH